jgi:hypothetical protein
MATQTANSTFQILGPHLVSGSSLNRAIGEGKLNAQDNIVALSGGGVVGAVPQLYLGLNRVSTAAAGGDSVMMPPSSPGSIVILENNGVSSVQVFANSTSSLPTGVRDTINGVIAATGVPVATGKMAVFCCFSAGAWVGPVALA